MADETQATGAQPTSQQEQIGFHKGALATLAKEREEMMRILNIVEQLMQMHIESLKKAGVDLEAIAKETKGAAQAAAPTPKAPKKPSVPLEDAL